MNVIVTEGVFSPGDKACRDYHLIPFSVSPGTRRVEVRYTFERARGSIVDLGLFDARGAEFLQAQGFRGWSGSDRDHVVVTQHSATPGYLPGPLVVGTWHVILGLVRIASAGCSYRVEITLDQAEGEAAWLTPPATPPYAPRQGPAWYRGDLQSHTHHSDAKGTVADLATAARQRGLDFVAVTDHNTVSHHADMPLCHGADLLLIPSEEITTYYGHANVWGLDRWLDFRCRTDSEMAEIIASAHRRGLLFSVNHPTDADCADCVWSYSVDLPFDCLEVWNGLWPRYNEQALAIWEGLLRQGRRVVAVGGSDKHQPPLPDLPGGHLLGHPTTYVYAKALTTEAILAGIRTGHVFISADVNMPRLFLTAETAGEQAMMGDVLVTDRPARIRCEIVDGQGHTLQLVTAQGVLRREAIQGDRASVEVTVDPTVHRYIRAEVRAGLPTPGGGPTDRPVLALTNPIYLDGLKAGS